MILSDFIANFTVSFWLGGMVGLIFTFLVIFFKRKT